MPQPITKFLYFVAISFWFLSLVCSLGSALGYLFSIIWKAKFIHQTGTAAPPYDKRIQNISTVLLGFASHLLLVGIPIYLFESLSGLIYVPMAMSVVVNWVETPLAIGVVIWLERRENNGILWRIILYALKLHFFMFADLFKVRDFISTLT